MGNCFWQTRLISHSSVVHFDSVIERMSCSKTEGPLATESAAVSA
jgi:hypothetical protein